MRGWFVLALFLNLWTGLSAEESFITNDEYAKMLYKNPRGIGCGNCHGQKGEGKVLSEFIKNGKRYAVTAPAIYNLPMKRFKRALKQPSKLMPEYFLTEKEMAYLYFYLLKQNPKKGKK